MTSSEFNTLKARFAYKHQDLAAALVNKENMGLRRDVNKEHLKLFLLTAYLDILEEYTLFEEDSEDFDNIFTADEMQDDILHRINKLSGTHYNANFNLEI